MNTLLKNTIMYEDLKGEYRVNFRKSFFELPMQDIHILELYAEVFKIQSRNGASPTRTLFERLKKYEEKNIQNI